MADWLSQAIPLDGPSASPPRSSLPSWMSGAIPLDEAPASSARGSGSAQQVVPPSEPGALTFIVRPRAQASLEEAAPDPEQASRQSAPSGRPATFDQRFSDDGSAPAAPAGLAEGMRARADEALVGPPSIGNSALTALSQAGNTLALNLPRNAAAALATGFGKLGVPRYSERSFSENYDRLKEIDHALDRQNPGASWAGFGAGLVGGAAVLPALSGAAKVSGRIGQGLVTGGVYGAAGEFADSKDPWRAGIAGGVGGVIGAAAVPLVESLAPVVARLAQRGTPYRDAAGNLAPEVERALREAGVNPAQIPAELDARLAEAFGAKGVSVPVAREALAGEFNIPLSRGQATGDPGALAREAQAASGGSGTGAQRAAQTFADRQGEAVTAAGDRLGEIAARGTPRLDNPSAAGELVADRIRAAADRASLEAEGYQRAADEALRSVRPAVAPDAVDAGASAIQAVREAADRSRAAYRGAYADVAAEPGTFAPGSLDRMGASVRARLGPEVPVDPVLTPAATRALADLDELPALLGTADGQGPGLGEVDQLRKRLVSYLAGTRTNPTDRRATEAVLRGLDDHLEDALASGLFSGSETALPRLREARELFGEHQRTFRPQGASDDVGRAMQQIVDRDAQPHEVANYLYGSSRIGGTGLSVRLAARIRDVVGAESPHWQAIQQGLLARAIDGREPQQVGAQIDHLLRGQGRVLAERVLTEEQRAALGAYRGAAAQAQAARTSLPEWVADLSRTGFDPNQVIGGLFGSGVPGARAGSTNFARALRGFLGEDSEAWSALRQAAVGKLIDGPAGRLPPERQAERVTAFLRGEGAGLSRELFSVEERGMLARYAIAVRQVAASGQASEAGRYRTMAAHALDGLLAGLALVKAGPAAAGAVYGARMGTKIAKGGLATMGARRSFNGGAPRAPYGGPTIEGTLAAPLAGQEAPVWLPAPR